MQDNTKETVKASLGLSARNPPVTSGLYPQRSRCGHRLHVITSHDESSWLNYTVASNGAPVGCQVIVLTSAWWLLNLSHGNKFSQIFIKIHQFSKKKMNLKISLGKKVTISCPSQCVIQQSLTVINQLYEWFSPSLCPSELNLAVQTCIMLWVCSY